jgi:tetratricopeptide (TPR) repeat protein
MKRLWWVVFAGVIWTHALGVAHASPTEGMEEEARNLFFAGTSAYGEGRYESALAYFKRAYELSGRGVLLFNMASAADRLRHDEDALRWYRMYLEEVPNAPNEIEVRARVNVLEREVSKETRLRSMITTRANSARDGSDEVSTVDAPPAHPPAESERASSPGVDDPAAPAGSNKLKLAGWITVGGGAALLLTATISGASALSLDNALVERCEAGCSADDQADIDRRDRLATASTVMLVGGGLAAVTGVVLVLLPSRTKERTKSAFTPVLGPGLAGGTWRRDF